VDVHPSGQGIEQSGPGPVGEALAQLAGDLEVVDAQQRVVGPQVADASGVELSGQPLPAVDIDLDREGKPALQRMWMNPSSGSMKYQ
jgi:hypothetical protein